MSEPVLTKEDKRTLKLIAELPRNEAFVLWRDKFCLSAIKDLKQRLRTPATLSDVELRASVMHLNSMEVLFEQIFEDARFLTLEE